MSETSKKPTISQQAVGLLLQSHSREPDPIAEQIKEAVDQGIVKGEKKRERRKYIGASSIGDECSRKIQYRYLNKPIDSGKEFTAQTLRIFQFGHNIEDYAAKWIQDAGFDLRTEDKMGEQYPMLWECKSANDNKFKAFEKHGVAKANPVYATQVALYQAYMELTETPCLFTVVNKNTSEIYYEIIPFNQGLAQEASDRAVNILTAAKANDMLPRIAQSKDFFLCKFCEYQDSCWGE
jgi:hypothetical protein